MEPQIPQAFSRAWGAPIPSLGEVRRPPSQRSTILFVCALILTIWIARRVLQMEGRVEHLQWQIERLLWRLSEAQSAHQHKESNDG